MHEVIAQDISRHVMTGAIIYIGIKTCTIFMAFRNTEETRHVQVTRISKFFIKADTMVAINGLYPKAD